MNWRDIPVPKRMRGLQKDRRGFPIPFIVLRGRNGEPIFTANDTNKRNRALEEERCPICGNRLDADIWFVGGPISAFHEHGAYYDTAMHYECMEYALRVCPHLAMTRYDPKADALSRIDMSNVPEDVVLKDMTSIPDKPLLFVAVMSHSQSIMLSGHVRPTKPYLAVEYWRNGEKLSMEEGRKIVDEVVMPTVKPCLHIRLDEDGICRSCGEDRRGY